MDEHSIKLFLFYQKYNPVIGIYPPELNQIDRYPFNWRNWFFLICLAQFFISIGAFICFKVESMLDFGPAFYIFGADVGGTIFYLIPIWQMGNTVKFIANCERFIENRKCIAFYKERKKRISSMIIVSCSIYSWQEII